MKRSINIKGLSLPFQILRWSFLPSPWMSHLAVASLSPSHSPQPFGMTLVPTPDAGGAALHRARHGSVTPSVAPSTGGADGAVRATATRPRSSAFLARCPRDPGGRGARARAGPPRPTWAHWHGGWARLQRQAAEPGRMTSPEQASTSPSSLSGPWAVASNTGLCPRQECKRSRKPQGPGHKPRGATPGSESAFSTSS